MYNTLKDLGWLVAVYAFVILLGIAEYMSKIVETLVQGGPLLWVVMLFALLGLAYSSCR